MKVSRQLELRAYHIKTDDLSVRLLDLSELHQKVPESRFGNNIVGGEYQHAIKLWGDIRLGWQMTPNDLVLGETPWEGGSGISEVDHQFRITVACRCYDPRL